MDTSRRPSTVQPNATRQKEVVQQSSVSRRAIATMSRVQPAGLGIFQDTPSTHRDTRSMSGDSADAGSGTGAEDLMIRPRSHMEDSDSTEHDMEIDGLLSDEDVNDHEETGLTSKARRPRRSDGSHDRGLDDLVAPARYQNVIPGANLTVTTRLIINGLLIAGWYTFSLSISLYNKWMFDPEHLNFKLPIFTTSVHMLVQFSLASSVLYFFPSFRAGTRETPDPHAPPPTVVAHFPSKRADAIMPLRFYISRIGPCGIATGLDIGLGNMSLLFISLTFYSRFRQP
jgi:solute carrier family 35 protein C2